MVRAKTADFRKVISLDADLMERIRRYRHARQFGAETEAIRDLLDKALAAEGFAKGGAK